MSSIVVTTPKSQMAMAAREAEDAKRAGGGRYFRRLTTFPAHFGVGDRVYWVEDGWVTGYAICEEIRGNRSETCDTSGRQWGQGIYLYVDAVSWRWIRPIRMLGFQGWRYLPPAIETQVVEVGGWMDPRPKM